MEKYDVRFVYDLVMYLSRQTYSKGFAQKKNPKADPVCHSRRKTDRDP